MRLLLASTSPYRRQLLERLGLPFQCMRPDTDETPRPGEAPAALARRLAADKARAVATAHPEACVIGSDQVADLDGRALGKPGDVAGAHAQLRAMSGRSVHFHTAVQVICPRGAYAACDLTEVRLRALDEASIVRYVAVEAPLDCAGSFKCESLGITLFEAIGSQDPTALVGLPLIALSGLLRQAGFVLP